MKVPAVATVLVALTASAAVAQPASKCTRLPLSDIQIGREETIRVAREKLDEYAATIAKKRGWTGPLARSAETVVCEDYLYLPLIGQEYKCLVTATYCAK